jgi:putative transposase
LIARYACLSEVPTAFLLRSGNGLVFTSRSYTALVKSYGLQREFITYFSAKQNGTVQRVIRTLKDQCVRRYRFETLQYARRVLVSGLAFTTTSGPTVTADTNAY